MFILSYGLVNDSPRDREKWCLLGPNHEFQLKPTNTHVFNEVGGIFGNFAQTLLCPSLSHDHRLFIFIFYFVLLTKHTHTHGSTLPALNHENLHHFLTCLLLFSLLSSTLESWEPWHERALISCWKHCTKWPFKSKNRLAWALLQIKSFIVFELWIMIFGC
jgi:hypothetical protein